jgi:hypothetical protein
VAVRTIRLRRVVVGAAAHGSEPDIRVICEIREIRGEQSREIRVIRGS